MTLYHMSWGKQIKQWDNATYLWEWAKSRTLTTPSVPKDVQQEVLFAAGGNAKCTATWGDSLAGSYKTKHFPNMWSSNCTP